MFGAEIAIGISQAMGSSAPRIRSNQFIQCRSENDLRAQHLSSLAQLQGQLAISNAMSAMHASDAAARTKRRIINSAKLRHLERGIMAKTRDGYRARRRAEIAVWISVGVVLIGGVVLPIGLRVYTSLWGWALGGG